MSEAAAKTEPRFDLHDVLDKFYAARALTATPPEPTLALMNVDSVPMPDRRDQAAAQGRGIDGSDSYDPYALDPNRDQAPDFPERSAAYAPEGYSACPFCGEEVDDRRSEIMAEAHLAVEKLISVEPGSDEFWQLRRDVAAFVGGEVDA